MLITVLRVYRDCVASTEFCEDICEALRAAEIYLQDPDCISVKFWNTETGLIFFDYDR